MANNKFFQIPYIWYSSISHQKNDLLNSTFILEFVTFPTVRQMAWLCFHIYIRAVLPSKIKKLSDPSSEVFM